MCGGPPLGPLGNTPGGGGPGRLTAGPPAKGGCCCPNGVLLGLGALGGCCPNGLLGLGALGDWLGLFSCRFCIPSASALGL